MKLYCCKDDVGFDPRTLAGTWRESMDKAKLESGLDMGELREMGITCVRVEIKEVLADEGV